MIKETQKNIFEVQADMKKIQEMTNQMLDKIKKAPKIQKL